MSEILSLRDASFSYGEEMVLKGISLSVDQGSFTCIVGQSGSGKTTLLKILAGLFFPSDGQIFFQGQPLETAKNLVKGHEEIKMVFQDYDLKHKMTVSENIHYALLNYESSYQEKRTEQLIELCNLTGIKDQYVENLSGGQKQRVAFARALSNEPAVVIMDEPFSNLDPATTQDLLQETKLLAGKTETTIVLVTHDTRDAMEAADKIYVLDQGRIIQEGTPREIYHQPNNSNVANLFGYVNELEAPEIKSLLSINLPPGRYGVWAENLLISTNGSEALVENVIFKGPYHVLIIKINNRQLQVLDFKKQLKVGDTLLISSEKKHLFPLL